MPVEVTRAVPFAIVTVADAVNDLPAPTMATDGVAVPTLPQAVVNVRFAFNGAMDVDEPVIGWAFIEDTWYRVATIESAAALDLDAGGIAPEVSFQVDPSWERIDVSADTVNGTVTVKAIFTST